MDRNFFAGKTILIMGLGKFGGGVDCAKFTAKYAKKVIITDKAEPEKLQSSIKQLEGIENIEFVLGEHREQDFLNSQILIVNPAVDENNSFVKLFASTGGLITSQIELFFELFAGRIVGITGSNGKSTTTALTAHLLDANPTKNRDYRTVILTGNIGERPFLEALEGTNQNDIAVLEISSFQLEQLARIKKSPAVSLITNLTPNHLDRHITFENYRTAKENIFKFQKQGDLAIFNLEDSRTLDMYERFSKTSPAKCILYTPTELSDRIKEVFPLPGKVNLSNLAGAVKIAEFFNVGNKTIKKAAADFKSLPHRLQLVSKKDGIRWYNDSIATTPESVIAAIEAIPSSKIIIAGGYDKGISFDGLAAEINKNSSSIKALILIGKTADKIAKAVGQGSIEIIKAASLAKAVQEAVNIADKGDSVLLSPACASYDMFNNFQERGEMFTELAKRAKKIASSD